MELDTIYKGDCLTTMRTWADESIDLVVTSPPYNMGAKGSGSNWKSSILLNDGYAEWSDDMPHDKYVAWQRDCLIEMLRLLKPTGAIFYNHKWRIQNGLLDMRQDITYGFPVRQVIIWDRGSSNNHQNTFFPTEYEVVYLITKPDFRRVRGVKHGDVWRIPFEVNNPHPAPFPLSFAERCISSTTAQLILDPFMGSGTTALAAKRLGRHYVGCELSQAYIDMANARLDLPQPISMFTD